MSTERKYTVSEINAMRMAIQWSYPAGVNYYQDERNADIERRLQTYMMNGTPPEELQKMAFDAMAQQHLFSRQQSGIGGTDGIQDRK